MSGFGATGILIALGIIFFILLAVWQGKRMRQKLKRAEMSKMDVVYDNELYVAADKGGENPLYQAPDLDKVN